MQPDPRENHQHTAATGAADVAAIAADAALDSDEQSHWHNDAASAGENGVGGGGQDGHHDHDDIVAHAINAAAAETYSMAAADLSSLNIPNEGEGTGASTVTSAPSTVSTGVPPMNAADHYHHQQPVAPADQDATDPNTGNGRSHGTVFRTDTKPPPKSMQELAMSHLYPSTTKNPNTKTAAAPTGTTNEQISSSSSSTPTPLLASAPASVPVPSPARVPDSSKPGNTAINIATKNSNKKDESLYAPATASSPSSSKRSGESLTVSSEMKKQKRARRVGKVPAVSSLYHAGFLPQRDNSSVNITVGEGALSAAAQAQAAVATGMLYTRRHSTMVSSFGAADHDDKNNNNNNNNNNADSPYNPNPPQMSPPQIHSQQNQGDGHAMSSSATPIVQGGGDNVDLSNRPGSIQYAEGSADHDAAVAAAVEAATSEIAAIDPSSTAGAMIGNDVLTNESTTTGNNDFNISTAGMMEQDHKPPIASDDAFATTMPANDIAELQYVSNPIVGSAGNGGINNHPFHHLPPGLGAGPLHPPDSITESGQVGFGADSASPRDDEGGEGPVSLSKHDKKWNALFEKLLEFKKKNNHTMVPQVYKDDPNLGRWVHYQRVEYWLLMAEGKGKITPQRIARLNSIGFEWNPQKARWDLMFQRLLQV